MLAGSATGDRGHDLELVAGADRPVELPRADRLAVHEELREPVQLALRVEHERSKARVLALDREDRGQRGERELVRALGIEPALASARAGLRIHADLRHDGAWRGNLRLHSGELSDGGDVVEFGAVNATIHKPDEQIPVADIGIMRGVYREILERLLG